MCLLVMAYRVREDLPLIILANRDEYYSRPTGPSLFWPPDFNVLGGRDLVHGGTWLGIRRSGRFAAITNYRDPTKFKKEALSRGLLASEFLCTEISTQDFLQRLKATQHLYNGFNIIFGDLKEAYWFSNQGGFLRLSNGIYGLSNHLLDTPWPKVEKAKEGLFHILQLPVEMIPDKALDLLRDNTQAADHLLPDTGVGLEWERLLSPIFISTPNYGTRSSTVILVEDSRRAQFWERSYHHNGEKDRRFFFQIYTS